MQLIYLVLTDLKGKITSIAYDLVDEQGLVFNADYEIGYNKKKGQQTLTYALNVFGECFTENIEAIPVHPDHYETVLNAFKTIKGGKELRAKFVKMNHRTIEKKAA